MSVKTFLLPDPGEGLVEADILSWRVAPGERLEVNDIVVEIETAKSLVELPIPWAGVVGELLVAAGDTVAVGAPIITVEVEVGVEGEADGEGAGADGEAASGRRPNLVGYGAVEGPPTRRRRRASGGGPAPTRTGRASHGASGRAATDHGPSPGPETAPTPEPRVSTSGGAAVTAAPAPPAASPDRPRPLTAPTIRRYARDRGIDLYAVAGTGPDGIITWADLDAFVAAGGAGDAAAAASAPQDASPAARRPGDEREVRVPVRGVRKHTAQAMVASAFTAPHVTEFVTIDMTASMELLERMRRDREFAGLKLSPLLFVARALLLACRRHPGVNAAWEQDDAGQAVIVEKGYVNLGIAASTPRGLLVPNVKDADRLSARELAEAIAALVGTAREGRTPPADLAGGTITITNVGVFGVDAGTPIINPGESAILCLGAVRRRPWVTARDGAERIEPRWVTQLALSFDHRIVDGDLGSRFLADVAAVLTDPATALLRS